MKITHIFLTCCLIVVLLSGCGEYEPLIEWSGNITERSERFIISYNTDKFPESQIEKIEQWWVDVQECTGVSIDISSKPLTIEYLPPDDLPNNRGRIEYYDKFIAAIEWDLMGRAGPNGAETRHELIHEIIFYLEGNTPANAQHSHLFFDMCD